VLGIVSEGGLTSARLLLALRDELLESERIVNPE
jgi:hypothetical protein